MDLKSFKFSLPGFLKRKGDSGEAGQPAAPQLMADTRPASLSKTRLKLLLLVVALPAAALFGVFQLMSMEVSRTIGQEAKITSQQVAARVAAMVDYYGRSAALLAKDPGIAALLMGGDEAALRDREESLRYVFPTAINVRLLPPGIDVVDRDASPPLSYAALAMMRAAESGKQPPMEVHLFKTPQQHVTMLRVVMDPAGSGVVGHIMLSLSNDVLQGILGDLKGLAGFIELQQAGEKGAPVVVATQGDSSRKDGDAAYVFPIDGSRWQVAYWPAVSIVAHIAGLGVWVVGAWLVLSVVLALAVIMLFRGLANAVRVDQVSFVTLFKDFRDGHVRQEYPGGLAEMNEALEFMTQLAVTAKPGTRVAPREQDLEYEADTGAGQQGAEAADEPAGAPQPDAKVGKRADFGAVDTGDSLVFEEGDNETSNGDDDLAIDTTIFRAYDIRGIVDKSLTVETVELIGRAIGSEALQRGRDTVVVGRDGRLSGPKLSQALIAGITATGCSVKDIGCVPTPVLYFATHYLDTQTGVVVTGSHNPPDYNGLKIVIDGETLSGESIQHLRERIEAQNFISGQGSVETLNIVPDYIERIRGDVKIDRPLKVVVDCGNGVAGGVAPELLKGLGCEIVELYCDVDGNFPNHHPDPSKAENLKDLIDALQSGQGDIGFAFDGDGDRLGVVTADGTIVWPDRVLMLFAADILDRNPGGKIIYDVKCSRFLDGIIREHGGEPLMWKTGHSFIKAKIKETGALLAGEMSGHIFIKERWYGFDDALYTGARLLEILARDPRPAIEVFAELPDSVNTPEINVGMQEGEPPVFIEKLLENAHFEGATISTIDGLRADFEDGWGLVRASNTTPVLVLRFEAENDDALARIMQEFRRVMLQVRPDLSLPF